MPKMGEGQFDLVRINAGAGHYLLLPSLTSTQRDALSAENGMTIYNSTTGRIETYESGGWKVIGQVYGDATFLKLAGGTMAGAIAMGNNKVTGLAAPTASNDAARKTYVDDAIDTDVATHAALTATHGVTGAILGTEDVDDTPVDGETTAPVSSNWAYDLFAANLTPFNAWRHFLTKFIDKPIDCKNWGSTIVNGGSLATSNAFTLWCRAAAQANSSIIAHTAPHGFAGITYQLINYDRALSLFFSIVRVTTDSEATSFVQLKDVLTIGQLAEKGIGLAIANLTLTGEAYGTSRGTVDLATTLTLNQIYQIEIRLTSTGVEFFVDGVSKGSITTSGQFPTGNGAAGCGLCVSHANGASGTSSDLRFHNPRIIQEL
jgi:hypothetical protein